MTDILALRQKIDEIDEKWIRLLAERFAVTAEVGKIKAAQDLPSVDKNREAAQMERMRKLAETYSADPRLIENILRLIINETVKRHDALKK